MKHQSASPLGYPRGRPLGRDLADPGQIPGQTLGEPWANPSYFGANALRSNESSNRKSAGQTLGQAPGLTLGRPRANPWADPGQTLGKPLLLSDKPLVGLQFTGPKVMENVVDGHPWAGGQVNPFIILKRESSPRASEKVPCSRNGLAPYSLLEEMTKFKKEKFERENSTTSTHAKKMPRPSRI